MSEDSTVPRSVRGTPFSSLRVDVVEGPDTGKSHVADAEIVTVGTAENNLLALGDPTVSRYHFELSRHPGGVLLVDHGSTNGTFLGTARIERAVVPAGTVLTAGRSSLRIGDGTIVTLDLCDTEALAGLHGRSALMRRVMSQVQRAAKNDAAVLLMGESGTGKEVVARALHDLGPRAGKPFVTVDCAALSPTLVSSELFGHERGAFTGADRQHQGAFERADGGTVFLDEIGELPAALQPALLGVLERRHFRRVGGRVDVPVDVRVISATHRDLRAEVNDGTFRLDLYYRIAVVLVRIPPLRDRVEDIPLLVEHFLRESGHDGAVESLVSAAAMSALRAHRWPGNVRELRNVIEATVAMGEASLPPASTRAEALSGEDRSFGRLLDLSYRDARAVLLEEFEKAYLTSLLQRAEGNVSRAAREAKMDRSHLGDLLRRHKVKA